MMKKLFLFLVIFSMLLTGCATSERDYTERVYAPQIVTGWKDADGKIHLKGVGGQDGFALVMAK